jgi:hypothetical protein
VQQGAKFTNDSLFSIVACCSFLDADADAIAVLASELGLMPLKCCITMEMVPNLDIVLGVLLLVTKLLPKISIPPRMGQISFS